ncbi:MAG: hypothetical protein WAN22_29415 [Solirubrobacteraceae bacterium]
MIGLVGVGASPSCEVQTTLDLDISFGAVAACRLARIDRAADERVRGRRL